MGNRLLVICLLLLPVMAFSFQMDTLAISTKTMYRCPPCGCSHDTHLFMGPGLCPSCQMPLVPLKDGLTQKVDTHLAPILETGMLGKLYTKLIYPVFAIGILLSFFFLFKNLRGKSLNMFLMGIICILALYGFKNQLYAVNYSLTNTYKSLFIPISFILLLGPMVWFYVKSLLRHPFYWKSRYWFHFMPASLFFLYYTALLVTPESIKRQFLFSPFEVRYSHLEQILAVLLGLVYTLLAFGIFRAWKRENPINNTKLSQWMVRFFVGITSLFLSWGCMIFLNFWVYDFGVASVSYNPLWLLFGMVLLWLGIEVFSNYKFFLWDMRMELLYGNKLMHTDDLSLLKSRLNQLMEDQKLYLNTDLSLDFLSRELGVGSKQLSAALNKAMGKSFYDFINQYRVNEVKARLQDPENRKLTIEAIANQAGFKSKSSFNNVFKKQTGMTPSEFIKQSK